MTNFTLNDLPESYSTMIEYIELIVVSETLTGSSSHIWQDNHSWKVSFPSLGVVLDVPKVNSPYQPPFIRMNRSKISIQPLNEFEQELKQNNIFIIKSESTARGGYVMMSGSAPKIEGPHWQFMFDTDKSIYNFYLICKKYKVF